MYYVISDVNTKKCMQKIAKAYGLLDNIGKKVTPTSEDNYRYGDVAEIVGWSINSSPAYCIKYANGECDIISAKSIIEERYVFID